MATNKKEYQREYMAKYRKTEKYKAYNRKYQREYYYAKIKKSQS